MILAPQFFKQAVDVMQAWADQAHWSMTGSVKRGYELCPLQAATAGKEEEEEPVVAEEPDVDEEPNATKMSFWSFGGADWTAERACG